jgi:hypothetical protein
MARLARVVIPDHPHHVTQRSMAARCDSYSDAAAITPWSWSRTLLPIAR